MATIDPVNAGPGGGRHRQLVAAAWLFALALGATRLARAEAPTPVRLTFAGGTGSCAREALEREIARRSSAVVLAEGEGVTTLIDVRVTPSPGAVEATLSIERAERPTVVRTVTGRSCAEVLEATALIVVVLLAPPVAGPPPPAPPPPAAASPPPPAPPPPPAWRGGGGTAGTFVTGIAPRPLLGVEAFLDGGTRRQGWSPALRAGVAAAWRSAPDLGGVRAAFRLTAATVSACPLAWLASDRFALRTCAAATVGSLEVTGSDATGSRAERHPWVTVGLGPRLELPLLRVLALEAGAAGEAALFEGRFRVDEKVVRSTSPVVFHATVGVAVRLP